MEKKNNKRTKNHRSQWNVNDEAKRPKIKLYYTKIHKKINKWINEREIKFTYSIIHLGMVACGSSSHVLLFSLCVCIRCEFVYFRYSVRYSQCTVYAINEQHTKVRSHQNTDLVNWARYCGSVSFSYWIFMTAKRLDVHQMNEF